MEDFVHSSQQELDELAVENFKEYLRIPSVHPDPDLGDCLKFLKKYADSLNLRSEVHYFYPNKPVLLMTWEGTRPELESILLNSHMDVVPVNADKWTHDPFVAEEDERGDIYARGSQDMKSVSVQYLEAIRRLKSRGVALRRTIHLSFVPDEEIGGDKGMKMFVESEVFKSLNVGFALDEGMTSPCDEFLVFYGERCSWKMHIRCRGQPGHGSILFDDTAGEKAARVLEKFYKFRHEQKTMLNENPEFTHADVVTINLTVINGGVQSNVIPEEFVLVMDSRIPVTTNLDELERQFESWCAQAGQDVTIEYEQKQDQFPVTVLDDSNIYWTAFKTAMEGLNLEVKPLIFPAATDSRYIRQLKIPVLGFSPMNHTELKVHDEDEYLNRQVFLKGISIYLAILSALGNAE